MVLLYVGKDAGVEHWLAAADAHASAQGHTASSMVFGLNGHDHGPGALALCCWGSDGGADPRRSGDLVHAQGSGFAQLRAHDVRALWDSPGEAWLPNATQVLASTSSGEVRAVVPPATTDQLVHVPVPGGRVFTDDIRALAVGLDPEPEPLAVHALLQYAAIPAPLTIFRGVMRAPPGRVLVCEPGSEPVTEPYFEPRPPARGLPDDPEDALALLLDTTLANLPSGSQVLFSGGIDSGLFAARLAELGRKDVTLLHFHFGETDGERELARRMARQLGMPFEEVAWQPSAIPGVLGRLGLDYSFPFGDPSVTPAHMLAQAALEDGVTVAVDGNGGGVLSEWDRARHWKKAWATPWPVRRLLAALYGPTRLWSRQSDLERRGDKARRTLRMTPWSAMTGSTNPLDGLAYEIPRTLRSRLEAALDEYHWIVPGEEDADKQACVAASAHLAAGALGPKIAEPLRAGGAAAVFPFLEPETLRGLLWLPWDERVRTPGDPRTLLKSLLARTLPREMAFRHKSAFYPPLGELFAHPATRELVNDALASDGPLRPFIRARPTAAIARRAGRGDALSIGAWNYLWVLGFTSAWLAQVRAQASAARQASTTSDTMSPSMSVPIGRAR